MLHLRLTPPPAATADDGTVGPFEVPQFSHGGVLVNLQWGYGIWNLDGANLNKQVVRCRLLQAVSGARSRTRMSIDLRIAYNILGHASVGVDFNATGWNVFNPTRGGSGYLTGTIAWHPLELVFIKKPRRPFGLDITTWVGLGYGILGISGDNGGPAAGMDGIVVQWGINAEYYFTRFVGTSAGSCAAHFLRFNTFYYDWDTAHGGGPAANAAQQVLNPVSGGSFWNVGIDLVFRVGD